MKVCILAQYYTPINAAPARRAERFVDMLKNKHEVTVLTGMPNYPTGRLPKRYRGRKYFKERIDGINIHRSYELPTSNTGFLKRIINFLSFGISAVFCSGKIGSQDVIIASAPPPTVLLAGYIISKVKRAEFVVDVRDLWPRSAVELGYFSDSALIRWIDRTILCLYEKADEVICVSRGMKKELARQGIKSSKIHVVHNTTDINKQVRRIKKTKKRPLITFVGNLSKSYDFIALADAANSITNADFLVVGDGEEKETLRKYLQKHRIGNVTLMKSVSAKEARRIINQSDLGVLPLRDSRLTGYTLPAKVFEYMAEAVPVAGFCRGELCDILETAGYVAPSAKSTGLTKMVKKAISNSRKMKSKGQAGRKLLIDDYSYKKAAAEIQNIIIKL